MGNKASTTARIVCRDSMGKIIKAEEKKLGNCQILTVETIPIREAIKVLLQIPLINIITESSSQVVAKLKLLGKSITS